MHKVADHNRPVFTKMRLKTSRITWRRFFFALAWLFLVPGAWALAPTPDSVVGDIVSDPVTGEDVEVVSLLQGSDGVTYAVVTDRNSLIFTIVNVGDVLPDTTGDWTVSSVNTNPVTGMVDQVTLTRTVPDPDDPDATITESQDLGVVSDFSAAAAAAAAAAAGAPGSPEGEIAPPTVPAGNVNWVAAHKILTGSKGGDGRDGYGVEICDPTGLLGCATIAYAPTKGGNGGTGPTINLTVHPSNGNIETITNGLSGITAVSIGGNGGQGGDAYGNIDAAAGGNAGVGGTVTVVNHVNISTSGTGAHGIFAQSRSGKAGDGGSGYIASSGGSGGTASAGGTVTVTNNGTIGTSGRGSHGIFAQSIGGSAGSGGDSWGLVGIGGSSAAGGNGGTVTVTNNGVIVTSGQASHGIFGQSLGGTGGDGGSAGGIVSLGGAGSAGGSGGQVRVTNGAGAVIATSGTGSHGILAQSIGGGGGNGGVGGGIVGLGADGAGGGNGSTVTVANGTGSAIHTSGNGASAILAQSIGGGGGNGGVGAGLVGLGASGSGGGNGGAVTVTAADEVSLHTEGNDAHALFAQSIGGGGGTGGSAGGLVVLGGQGSGGGSGGTVSISSAADIYTEGLRSRGIFVQSIGGGGGNGAGAGGAVSLGGRGYGGGNGGAVSVTSSGNITTKSADSDAVFAQSIGGGGGSGGASGGLVSLGGSAGSGGSGSSVTITNSGTIQTFGDRSRGLFAQSIGGGGGSGAGTGGVVSLGGSSSVGGNGGAVAVQNSGRISTWGETADAIFAQSIGGGGGSGGGSGGLVSLGGSGSGGGSGGSVSIGNSAQLFTEGGYSRGIFAQSIGGGGGNGAGSGGAVSLGGSAGRASHAGAVSVQNSGSIATRGERSDAILAQSIGGGGGNGAGSGGLVSLGGGGAGGGNGGQVTVDNSAYLFTSALNSRGILAQSIGGGGGNGAGSGGLVSLGGTAGSASQGGAATVRNSGNITTLGDSSEGILAQSIGGGGGNGGTSGGMVSLGGTAGGGGDGSAVVVENSGRVATAGDASSGIFAQSIGGGGGNGGNSIAVGAFISAALGGSGGLGGDGGGVQITNSGTGIQTEGNSSYGILAQSVGGGGGNGGFAVSASVGYKGSVGFGLGGSGGGGGVGGQSSVDNGSNIVTLGDDAHAIFAQSIGGGGGSGGFSIAASISDGVSGALSIGGSGGDGGTSDRVDVISSGRLHTEGDHSYGILAQSVGGGGGDGGFSIAGGLGLNAGLAFSFGGSGGPGGAGGIATIDSRSEVTTLGHDSHGLVAQSIGGGGGTGGFSIAGALGLQGAALGVSFGGSGSGGGNASAATLGSSGDVVTLGDRSYGILAQSIGGGGGSGGFSVAGGITKTLAVNFSLGGSAGTAGAGGLVTVASSGSVATSGADAHAVVAQSIGGGGGTGGFSVAGGIAAQGAAIGASIGGSGGGGGNSGNVSVTSTGAAIVTLGARSFGILAQSVGGGGGDGGFSVAGGMSKQPTLNFSLGGGGGTGSSAGNVTVGNHGVIHTEGGQSYAIAAQSIGGGGGSGGFSVAGSLSTDSGGLSAGVGGFGAGGGHGRTVQVANDGILETLGNGSHALLAQSIGGGGGSGGFSGSFTGGFGDGASLAVAVGGSGDGGGDGGSVTVTNNGNIVTLGDAAYGLYAQSIGGGGGDGGGSLAAAFGTSEKNVNLSVAVGGSGGSGGSGGTISVNNAGKVTTGGEKSDAIVAQSIGGGGGNGGFSATGALSSGTGAKQLSVSVGGSGGSGGTARNVAVTNSGAILTTGDGSRGIVAQSIGGSGGNSGFSFTGAFGAGDSKNLSVSIGGAGGDGNTGGNVTVENAAEANIETAGEYSYGILAQSIGGGGGTGGSSTAVAFGSGGDNQNINLSIAIGGGGGYGNAAGEVDVRNLSSILTNGSGSHGIYAQSIGGGGGAGGASLAAVIGVNATNSGKTLNLTTAIGGAGGSGNHGGTINVDNEGRIDTFAADSHGILAQSIGGGGGSGGSAGTINFVVGQCGDMGKDACAKAKAGNKAFSLSVGGNGGGASNGGLVDVTNTGHIVTRGAESHGVMAQSVGGGGGIGGQAQYGLSSLPSEGDLNTIESIIGAGVGVLAGQTKMYKDLSIVLGGSGGSSGDGGTVVIDNSGSIVTLGDGSAGLFGQSVGGGGGVGGLAAIGATGKLGIGGEGGAAGDGGNVTLMHSGNIATQGAAGYGIFAQSVGGGGGVAGNVEQSLPNFLNIGLGLNFGRDGGGGGDGGLVSVLSSGDILTRGTGATAIFAQSVGGGGGLGGSVGLTGELLGFAGSVGGAGSGGVVTVEHTGNIMTEGTASFGIYAQSEGGQGSGGEVTLRLSGGVLTSGDGSTGLAAVSRGGGGAGDIGVSLMGDIMTSGYSSAGLAAQSHGGSGQGGAIDLQVGGRVFAMGLESDGILAESTGGSGAGDIAISLEGDLVVGGSGGSAVKFVGGNANRLANRGLLATLDGIQGLAISGSSGGESVDNYGLVLGNVALGAGSNAFYNHEGGVFFSGEILELGSGNRMTNDGWLAPGESSQVLTTVLTGDFLQNSTGTYFVDIDFNGNLADRISATGQARLEGRVALNTMNPENILPGYHTMTIVSGAGGFTGGEMQLDVLPSAVVDYALVETDGSTLELGIDVDFSPAGLNHNQTVIGDCLNRIQLAGSSTAMGPVIAELFTIPDAETLAGSYHSMSPELYDNLTAVNLEAGRRYNQALLQRVQTLRHSAQSGYSTGREKSRPILLAYNASDVGLGSLFDKKKPSSYGLWFNSFGQIGEQNERQGYDGYDFDTYGFSSGFDRRFRRDFLAGISLGYSKTSIEINNGPGAGDIESYQISLYSSYFTDRFYLDGAASYGRQYFKNVRQVQLLSSSWLARSNHDGDSWSVYGEAGYRLKSGNWYLQPFLGLQYLRLDEERFSETGAEALSLHVARRTTDALYSNLGTRFGGAYETSAGVLTAEVSVAWNYDFDLDDRTVTASFAGYPGASFSIRGREVEEQGLLYGIGLNFFGYGGFSASLKYNQELRNGFRTQGMTGEIRYEF